ncbi:MAG: hypothetical protein H7138_19055 [Myxococcales bacterium]|nr:hypothetical protein [Myxococcales bacterium]
MGLHRCRLPLFLGLVNVLLLHAAGVASADDPNAPQDPAAPYQVDPGQPPVYLAPLSQQTQTTYVPQSVALSGPEVIKPYDDSRPAPAGYTETYRKRKGLIVGGAVTFGVSYGIAMLAAAAGEDASNANDDNELAALWIPVAGPFIQMSETESAFGKVFLAGMGGAQLAGALMLYYGMTSQQRIFVRNDLIGSLTVSPMAGNGASGMMLSGSF